MYYNITVYLIAYVGERGMYFQLVSEFNFKV